MKYKFLIALFFILFFSVEIRAENKNLTKSEIRQIEEEGYSISFIEIKNSVWPEVVIKTFVNATPKESAAVFSAYDEHIYFIPDLEIAKPVLYHSSTELDIYFKLKIPWPLKDSEYTTYNRIEKLEGGGYGVFWKILKSSSTKEGYGKILFLPYGKKTLLIYDNYSNPKQKMAKLFKSKMIKKVIKTVKSIVRRIEYIKYEKGNIKDYTEKLDRALEGEYVYENVKIKKHE